MFNNHTMSLVMDLRLIQNEIRNVDFITVAAITTSKYPEAPNIYYAGILIHPTEMLMEWVDGNQLILQNEYPKYLMEKECDDMIIALIAAMTQKNVILYIPQEENEVFGALLLNHLYYMYGITCNTPFSTFSLNQNKIPLIISKFYLMNVMDPDVFLSTYPANYMLPDIVVNKLAEDLHPFNYPATFDQYRDYFNKLNASKANHRQTVMMTRPVDNNEGSK